MLTITENGKTKNYRYQILVDSKTKISRKYLKCDDSNTHITRYIFRGVGDMRLFTSEVGKLDSVVGLYQNEQSKFVDVIAYANQKDEVGYAGVMMMAIYCNAVELGSTDHIPEFYFEEFDCVLGEIPTEEIEIDTNLGSFAEKTNKVR